MLMDAFDYLIKQQISECIGLPHMSLSAEISIGYYRINAIAIVSLTQRHHYLTDMFEDVMVTLAVQVSEYKEAILVGKEDITIKLTEKPYGGGKGYTKEYNAILVGARDEQIESNRADISQTNLQDNMSMSIITFQLLTSAAADIRLREVGVGGTTFINQTAPNVLRHFLANTTLVDNFALTEVVGKINVDSIASTQVYSSITIPEGTNYLALPSYLQDRYGVFPQGLGCYLKDQSWYVFAPYGLSKKDLDVHRLIIINAPSSKYRSIERNFKIEGRAVTIITTGESKHRSDSNADALNGGTGVRYGDMRTLMAPSSTKGVTDSIRAPEEYITEYRASNYHGSYQKTVTAKERFTDNPLLQASILAARGGDVVTVQWENGSLDPLVPGMPVVFYYGVAGKIEKIDGTLIQAERLSSIPLGGIIEPKHQSTVQLTLWLKRI